MRHDVAPFASRLVMPHTTLPLRHHGLFARLAASPRSVAMWVGLSFATLGLPSRADELSDGSAWLPNAAFVQAGHGSYKTLTGTVGLIWRQVPIVRLGPGTLTYYFESSVGRWVPQDDAPNARTVTQFGITPVLRWQADNRWFGEAGIGANGIAPVYRDGRKEFSTVFEFGDHLGVGRSFGAANEHEVAFRVQHYSNAGISHPNPGINFFQLRYAHTF